MSNKVYALSQNFCRGDVWTEKETFEKDKLIGILEKASKMDDDAFDDFTLDLEEEVDYDQLIMILAAITNGDFIIDGTTRTDRTKKNLKRIKNDESFVVELEESTIAFGSTKKDAMLAYAEFELKNQGDTDW